MINVVKEFVIHSFKTLDSTQDQLHRQIAQGQDVHGVIVVAGHQTAGRGRNGNVWQSPTGGSYQSVAFRCQKGKPRAGLITIAIGVCIAESMAVRNIPIKVKWPNGLYLGDLKIGGILGELSRGYLILGVGINAAQISKSVLGENGFRSVEEVHHLVRKAFRRTINELPTTGDYSRRFAELDFLAGRTVVVKNRAEVFSGAARGIDRDGCLKIEGNETLGTQVVCSGSVETIGISD